MEKVTFKKVPVGNYESLLDVIRFEPGCQPDGSLLIYDNTFASYFSICTSGKPLDDYLAENSYWRLKKND